MKKRSGVKLVLYTLFLLVLLIELYIDFSSKEFNECLSKLKKSAYRKVIAMSFFHHIIATFMMYGWLLPNKTLLFLFVIACLMMLTEWYRFGYCRLTSYVNEKCGQSGNFRDLLWKLGFKQIYMYKGVTLHQTLAFSFLCFGMIHYLCYDYIH
jgi:hypothetical protein